MAEEKSFPLRFLHAIDRLIAPKDKPPKGPSPELQARRKKLEYEMTRPGRTFDADDSIADQVDRLRRRRKAFSLGQSDEPDL